MNQVSHLYRQLWQFVNGMDTQEWLIALIAVVLVGFVCLRGFGSRSNY